MIKRSGAIMLMLLYVGTVSGFALNLHFCFNYLASVKVDAPAKFCVQNSKNGKMNCCKEKHIEIKIKDAHQGAVSSFDSNFLPLDLPVFDFAYLGEVFQNACENTLAERGPPQNSSPSIFLRNCIFRI